MSVVYVLVVVLVVLLRFIAFYGGRDVLGLRADVTAPR